MLWPLASSSLAGGFHPSAPATQTNLSATLTVCTAQMQNGTEVGDLNRILVSIRAKMKGQFENTATEALVEIVPPFNVTFTNYAFN